jgi:hypothetical protein
MPHFKCVACRTRLYSAATPPDRVADLCPGCGSLLEPVDDLAEIVGFQSIRSRESYSGAPSRNEQIADRVDDFFAGRRAILAQARHDAERWLDDGGSFSPEAVAAAVALPTPNENR